MACLLSGGMLLAPGLASRLNRSPATDVMDVENPGAALSRPRSAGPRTAVLLRLLAQSKAEDMTAANDALVASEDEDGQATTTTTVIHGSAGTRVATRPSPGTGRPSRRTSTTTDESSDDRAPPPRPTTTTTTTIAAESVKSARTATGIASWYETYDGTCAHKSLPKGTIVSVVNLENGRHASCRVADRGPYLNGRIIDLDLEIFDRIADRSQGLTAVRIAW